MAELNAGSLVYQVMMLVLICLIPIGSYFGMDSPAPIETALKKSLTGSESTDETGPLDLSHSNYMMFMTIYTLPNIVLCFFAGYFIDTLWGRRKAAIICSTVVASGAFLFATGAYMNNLILCYVGRFIFGIGSESVALCEYAYNIHWFDKTKIPEHSKYKPFVGLGFAFSIAISFSRASTALAFQTLERSYNAFAGINNTATYLARYGDNIECTDYKILTDEEISELPSNLVQKGQNWASTCSVKDNVWTPDSDNPTHVIDGNLIGNETIPAGITKDDYIFKDCDKDNNRLVCVPNYAPTSAGKTLFVAFAVAVFTLMISAFLSYYDIMGNRWRKRNDRLTATGESQPLQTVNGGNGDDEKPPANNDDKEELSMIGWEDIKSLPYAAWLIMLICTTYYMTIFPFVSQAKEFLRIYRGVLNSDTANTYSSLILVLSGMGVSPAIGYLIDTYKYNCIWLIFGISLTVFGHVSFWILQFIPPLAIVLCLGVGYSAVAGSLWPLLSYNVPKKVSSTCYGLMQSMQLFGLFISYRVSGSIMDAGIKQELTSSEDEKVKAEIDELKKANYFNLEMYFTAVIVGALVLTIMLFLNQGMHGHDTSKKEEDEQKN